MARSVAQAPATRRERVSREEQITGLLFLAPSLLLLVTFVGFPVVFAFFMSFQQWSATGAPIFIGLDNYLFLLRSPEIRRALINTTYYVVGTVPSGMILALLVAMLVNRPGRHIVFFRSLYFLPVVTSGVAIAFIFQWLYEPRYGLINSAMRLVGVEGPGWLNSPVWAMPAVMILNIWHGLGFGMMIYLAALQGIPEQYYEAASIDGASRLQAFWHVTIPLLQPATFFLLVTGVIQAYQVFNAVYLLTDGGPLGSTETLVYVLWANGFRFFRMGLASALAYAIFLIVMVFTLLEWYGLRGYREDRELA